MKTLVKLLLLLALIVYLVFAFTTMAGRDEHTMCREVNITVADSSRAGFITSQEVERMLRSTGLYPIGKAMGQIDGARIEKELQKQSFIESATCYKAPGGTLNVLVSQRLPVLRVMADNGDDYYLDAKGCAMSPAGYVADIAVATGAISRRYARKELIKLGLYLRDNDFWNAQIEQIHVTPSGQVELFPRVGRQMIVLGGTDSIPRKFQNLYTFYQKVMPEVGWNKYSSISVEHVSQIVAKRAEK